MRVSDLKREMDERFAQVDARFAQVDARFEQVDARFVELQQQIAAEGEATRRHFDVVAEQFRAEVRLTLDKAMASGDRIATLEARHTTDHADFTNRLANHEARLKRLEQKPR